MYILTLRSVFYNDLFVFDMERRRWYHLALKKAAKKKDKGDKTTKGNKHGRGGGSPQVMYGVMEYVLMKWVCPRIMYSKGVDGYMYKWMDKLIYMGGLVGRLVDI